MPQWLEKGRLLDARRSSDAYLSQAGMMLQVLGHRAFELREYENAKGAKPDSGDEMNLSYVKAGDWFRKTQTAHPPQTCPWGEALVEMHQQAGSWIVV